MMQQLEQQEQKNTTSCCSCCCDELKDPFSNAAKSKTNNPTTELRSQMSRVVFN